MQDINSESGPENINETSSLESLTGSDLKIPTTLGSTKPSDPLPAITDTADEDEEDQGPVQGDDEIALAQKNYEAHIAEDSSRVPNVVLAPSKEDQALNAGMNVVGTTGFHIPNIETQMKGFYVADPGKLVHQHRQYKHFVKKGDDVPSVKTN